MAIRDGDDNINNLFTFCECHVTATCTVCMQFKIEFHFSVFFFCLSKFIAGNFRVLVEVLNRKINSFVAGTVNMLGSVASLEDFRTTCRKARRAVKVPEHCIF